MNSGRLQNAKCKMNKAKPTAMKPPYPYLVILTFAICILQSALKRILGDL